MWKSSLAVGVGLVSLCGANAALAQVPSVVVSIKPVHSLAAAVMDGIGEPTLLLDGTVSPHTYVMRPSDARVLDGARLLFWVGPGIESFLERGIETLATNAKVVTLADEPGLDLLPYREGGFFEPHAHGEAEAEDAHGHTGHDHTDHDHDAHDHGDHAHGHEGMDTHLWLAPRNAIAMTGAIAAHLAEADPANAAAYEANAAAEIERLEALQTEIGAMLEPVSGGHFIVFHDSFQYFENAFGVEAVASVTVSPEVTPGARRISELQAVIAETGAVCLAAEPQFPRELVDLLATDRTRTTVLDPYGVDLEPGPRQYEQLLRQNAEALLGCLEPQG